LTNQIKYAIIITERKRKEVHKMQTNRTNYINQSTGELTVIQAEAMEWYRAGNEVAVWSWSETLQKMVERVVWVHDPKAPY
jgi:hypothetical protein